MAADDPEHETTAAAAETLVRRYLDLWNARDFDPIWSDCYAADARLPWDRPGMRAAMERIEALGFSHSEVMALWGEAAGADAAEVHVRFRRVTHAGETMAPGVVLSIYDVARLPEEGWRITAMRSVVEG